MSSKQSKKKGNKSSHRFYLINDLGMHVNVKDNRMNQGIKLLRFSSYLKLRTGNLHIFTKRRDNFPASYGEKILGKVLVPKNLIE